MRIIAPINVDETNLLTSNVSGTDNPAWVNTKLYITGEFVQVDATGSHHNYESLVGSSSVVTISTSNPAVVTWTAHGLAANTPIQFTTTGALPTGITAGSTYYVIAPTTNSFNISATSGGSTITTTGTQSGVHTARASTNIGFDPASNPTKWLDLGSINKYKMFDKSVQSQTANASSVDVKIYSAGYADTIVLLNIVGTSARVKVTHPVDGTIYDVTKTLSSTRGIVNWYRYFFTPIVRITDIIFEGIPYYAGITIEVIVSTPSGNAAIGACLIGSATDISSAKLGVEQGAKLSIVDYSLKQQDAFGNYTIKERAFNRKANWTVYVNGDEVDAIYSLLSTRRATPTVYIGGADYGSSILYGFFKAFDIDINYKDMPAVVTIELEALT